MEIVLIIMTGKQEMIMLGDEQMTLQQLQILAQISD
jgi:hypothetical protein